MTPREAKRRATRRIRRRRRRILARALLFVPIVLGAAGLATNFVEVSRNLAGYAPLGPPPLPRNVTTASRPRVPVPVFHPSILLDALELEIPPLDPLDLELRDPKLERALAKRRAQTLEKKPAPPKQLQTEEDVVPVAPIQISALQPHLLEIIKPRPYVEPEAKVLELLPPPIPVGWPMGAWIDFPIDPDGGLKLLKPLPGKKKKKKKEEKPPPVVPEPGTAVLLALGLALLGTAGRRS